MGVYVRVSRSLLIDQSLKCCVPPSLSLCAQPVHIAIQLAIPPKQRCTMDSLMDCVGIDDDGNAGLLYTRFYDMQPWVWLVYVAALTLLSALLTEYVDKYVTGFLMKVAPRMPSGESRKTGAAASVEGVGAAVREGESVHLLGASVRL